MVIPTIDQFAEVSSLEPDWYTLGIFLGAPSHELDTIGLNYRGISKLRCLVEVYKCLENRGNLPSWDFIANNLRRMNNHSLADRIDLKYIQPSLKPSTVPPSRPSSSLESSNSSGNSVDQSKSADTTKKAPEVMVPSEISKQYMSLSIRLTKLYLCVQKALADANENIDNVQHVIKRHWGLLPYVGNEATWENVFHRLDEECSMFDDPHILSLIIDTFLSRNQLLSIQMGEFEKAVDSLKSSAEMGHLVDLLKKKKRTKGSNCQTVKLKVQERWSRCTVKHFEAAMKELLGSLYRHLSCMLVDKGCYCISWIVATDVSASKLLPDHSEQLFKIIGVISLQIDEEMVYESTEKVPGCEVLEAAMLQAIELKNTQAVELLLTIGCSPEVGTYIRNHAITNVVNIRERSVDDDSGGGMDHVCVLGHNEHIEAIVDPSSRPECAGCRIKKNQIAQLHQHADTLQLKIKALCLEKSMSLALLIHAQLNYHFISDAQIQRLTEQLQDKGNACLCANF